MPSCVTVHIPQTKQQKLPKSKTLPVFGPELLILVNFSLVQHKVSLHVNDQYWSWHSLSQCHVSDQTKHLTCISTYQVRYLSYLSLSTSFRIINVSFHKKWKSEQKTDYSFCSLSYIHVLFRFLFLTQAVEVRPGFNLHGVLTEILFTVSSFQTILHITTKLIFSKLGLCQYSPLA